MQSFSILVILQLGINKHMPCIEPDSYKVIITFPISNFTIKPYF